jgi:PAS domain S-box-containing protein
MTVNAKYPRSVLLTACFLAGSVFLVSVLSALLVSLLFPSILPGLGKLALLCYLLVSLFLSSGLGLTLALRLNRDCLDPLRGLIRRAREFSMGQEAAEITHERGSLIEELCESFQEMEEATRRRLERANRNWKELARLFDLVPCYISVQDRNFHIIRSNRLFKQAFGEDHRKHCYEVYKELRSPCPKCSVAKSFLDGQVHSNEEEVITRDGKKVSLIVYSAPIVDETGEIVAVMEMSTDISGVKRLQVELEIQRQKYEQLFDAVPCYISVQDRDLNILQTNEMFKRDFGDREGRKCHHVYKGSGQICPECPVQKTFQDGKVHSSEEVVVTKEGEQANVIVYTSPIRDEAGEIFAVMEMSTNITEVKKLQSELEAQRKKYEQLFEMVPCYISIHDRNFNILQVNEMFKRDFGDREGQKCHRVYKGSNQVCHDCPVQKTFRDGRVHSSEEVVVTKEGEQANVIVYTSPVRDEAGEIYAVMEMSTNITEIKKLQQELVLMGQTVANMAHTIKNLLMGLEGGIFVVSTALEQKDDALLMEGWDMVHRNVAKVSHMVKDLLYCAKEREHRFKWIDPGAVAREVYELFEEKAKTDEIELRLEVEDSLPRAEFDPDAIHNLLSNLISNAIDACRFDFSKKVHWISLRASAHAPAHIKYEVSDNGKGIPAEWSNKVFDNFFSTKGDKGTGLGLLVARKVVQEHHGEITFTSEPDQGTTFQVSLPVRQPEAPTTAKNGRDGSLP